MTRTSCEDRRSTSVGEPFAGSVGVLVGLDCDGLLQAPSLAGSRRGGDQRWDVRGGRGLTPAVTTGPFAGQLGVSYLRATMVGVDLLDLSSEEIESIPT